MNLEAYLQEQLGYLPKPSGREGNRFYRCECVDCNYDGDISRQLWIRADGPRRGNFGCWRCESHGNFVGLIAHLEQIPYGRARKKAELYESIYGDDIDEECRKLLDNQPKHAHQEPSDAAERDFILSSVEYLRPKTKAFRYLLSRGFTEKDIEDWDLKWCTAGRLKDRIVVPVRDPSGRYIRAWQGRTISKYGKPPYLATSEQEGTNIKHLVLNVHRAQEPLVLVEGLMDAMAVGARNSLCFLGKGISPQQLEIVRSLGAKEVLVVLDGDVLDDDVLGELRCFCDARAVRLPYGEDPASLGRKKFWEIVKKH